MLNGDGPDAAGYDAKHQLAFSSQDDGTLSIVDTANGYKTIGTVPTQKGARTMAFDAGMDRVYVVTADLGPWTSARGHDDEPASATIDRT